MEGEKKRGKESGGRRIRRILLMALISLIFGFSVYFWNARHLVGNTLPMPFGYGVAVVLSGSMEPELSVNDLVVIRLEEEYVPGDIAVCQSGQELIIHRVVSVSEGMVQMQGDANNVPDPPVPLSDIKGKLIARIPKAGTLVRVLKTPAGTGALLLALLAVLEGSNRRERRKDEEELESIKAEIRRLKEEREIGGRS